MDEREERTRRDAVVLDWRDGEAAVDRAFRTIVLVVADVVAELTARGYDRDLDSAIVIDDRGLPAVELRGRRAFEFRVSQDGSVATVHGVWLDHGVPPPGRLRRWWRSHLRRGTRDA